MSYRSLTERLMAADGSIKAAGTDTPGGTSQDVTDLMESILHNLNNVLNSRADCSLSRPDFGMPDFNDLAGKFPDALGIIASAVRTQIELFEPRITQVTVRHIPDRSNPLRLAFRIHATLLLDHGTQRLSFDTVLNNNGYVKVSD